MSRIVDLGRGLFKVRGWVYIPFAAAAMLLPREPWSPPEVLWPAGLAFIVLGIGLRFVCIRRMGGAARTHKHKAKRLVDGGPYAWVRNPLYVANTGAFLGFLLLCGLPLFTLGSWLLLWAYYHAIARYEETVLKELFGEEFEAYRRKVPLWIPRPPKDPPVEDPADFYPFAKILQRERGALLNVAAMIGLAAAKRWLL
jgi:protein-S-isoprenylcysteine O-methyltransferase Ste14